MAIPNPVVRFTYQDYLNTPEDKRYELLEGDLVTIATPGELHQSVSAQLGMEIGSICVRKQSGAGLSRAV